MSPWLAGALIVLGAARIAFYLLAGSGALDRRRR